MRILYLQKDPFVNAAVTQLVACTNQAGHESKVLIENAERDLRRAVRRFNPDLVAFSITTGAHLWAMATAVHVKRWLPKVKTVFGGMHATFFPEMIDGDAVDIVCVGEGEGAMVDLADAMERREDINGITNLWVKDAQGVVHKNPMRLLIQDLDSLPFPDRSVYDHYSFVREQAVEGFITGRGCPDSCTFCFHVGLKRVMKGLGRYSRRKSPEYVVREIEHYRRRYRLKRVVFRDDTFVVDYHNYVKPLMKLYRERVGLPFSALIRADYVDEEAIADLAASGCYAVKMGVETGDEATRRQVLRKDLSDEDIIRAMESFRKHGIKVQTSSILGSPGETLASAWQTLEFNTRLKPDHAWCSLVQPYPGTTLAEQVMRDGLLPEGFDPSEFEQSYFISTPVDIENKREITNLQKLFPLAVRFPAIQPLVRQAIKLPPNQIFNFIFKSHYAWSIWRFNEMDLGDFVRIGLRTRNYFSDAGMKIRKPPPTSI